MTWSHDLKGKPQADSSRDNRENESLFTTTKTKGSLKAEHEFFKIRKWGLLSLDLEIKHHAVTLLKVTQASEFVQESVKHDKQILTIPELLKIPTDSFWFCKQSGAWRQDKMSFILLSRSRGIPGQVLSRRNMQVAKLHWDSPKSFCPETDQVKTKCKCQAERLFLIWIQTRNRK